MQKLFCKGNSLQKYLRLLESESNKARHCKEFEAVKFKKAGTKNSIDEYYHNDKIYRVKHSLPNLLDRLRKSTRQHGRKAALAKFLGANSVSVSQWLSGNREPGGQTTLQMLNWVEQQERQ